MNQRDDSIRQRLGIESAHPRRHGSIWQRLDHRLEQTGEWFSPILIKEARQSLKSRQFVFTFSCFLLTAWGWSVYGVAVTPGNLMGLKMLVGYFWILAFPLIIIVPFSAYRSMAAEWDDGTYELVSITALEPWQIIGGKLGSAMLQIMIYYSAISPCIAFTFLLQGVDIVTIILLLAYTFLSSFLLSTAGLCFATLSTTRQFQVVISVLVMICLFLILFEAGKSVTDLLNRRGTLYVDDDRFWIDQAAVVSLGISCCAMFFSAAAARISFSSDNRSTRLRVLMTVQQALLVGWTIWYWISEFPALALTLFLVIEAIYWAVMGALMIGESPGLSQRISRNLPTTTLSRSMLSFFYPGPGAGYMFAMSNMMAMVLLVWCATVVARRFGFSTAPAHRIPWFGVLATCYVAIYVGLARLFIILARRYYRVQPFGSFLLTVVLICIGSFGSLTVQLSLRELFGERYTILQVGNPFWTLSTVASRRTIGSDTETLILLCASAVLLANMLLCVDEVRRQPGDGATATRDTPVRDHTAAVESGGRAT